MIIEYRKVRTSTYGSEENASAAVLDAVPNSTIVNTKRIAQSGMNPIFIFDLEVVIPASAGVQEQKSTKKTKTEDEDD
jgi:hypothetical protein